MRNSFLAAVCAVAAAVTFAPGSQAATLTAQLNCVLNTLGGGPCVTGGSFGSVSITDEGVAAGEVKVTVDLLNGSLKFRDLMMNFGGAATTVSSSDGQASLAADTFSISPYGGLFDIGEAGGQGWDGDSGYITTLSGNAALSLPDFDVLDTLGNLNVALHIQSIGSSTGDDCDGSGQKPPCVPGMAGPGSLKIGGTWRTDDDTPGIPEPSTYLLFGTGLFAAGWLRRRRAS